jgi:hypothetical protein
MTEVYPLHRRAAAWAVHLYTALGLPIALIATAALSSASCKWAGWSSSCMAPDRKTDEFLSKLTAPSGLG